MIGVRVSHVKNCYENSLRVFFFDVEILDNFLVVVGEFLDRFGWIFDIAEAFGAPTFEGCVFVLWNTPYRGVGFKDRAEFKDR